MGTSDTSPTPEREQVAALKSEIVGLTAHIKILEEQLRLATVKTFTPSSEKLSGLGHPDLFNEAEALGTKPEIDTQASEIIVPAHTRERGKRKPIDPQLPRTRIEHDIPDDQKTCACGCQLTRIGEVTSEQIGMIPARGFVKQHVRFKYACRSCEGTSLPAPCDTPAGSRPQGAVITAELPAQPLPKSNCSPELAAFITVSKYADGLPLYRLEGILQRYMISVSRTAMACWMIKLGDLVQPLIDLFNAQQLAYDVLQMDETSVQVLKEDGRAPKDKSYMWVRRGGAPDQTSILFDYAASRAGAVPLRLLSCYQGFLQTDDYAGYNATGKQNGVKHVGCLDHARRKFVDAVKAQHAIAGQERGLAPEALLIIRKLYAVEKLARDAQMSAEQRHKLRQETSKPIWDELRTWLDKNLGATPPQSLTGKAINYLAAGWPRLIRYLDDGRVEISNVLCENAIRPFVIGRKNWLFSDTPAGAHASAKLYSIVETAKAYGIEPYAYLAHIFEKLPQANTPADIEALLPWNIQPDQLKPTR